MFEVGDTVMVNSFYTPKLGKIIDWHYDEGDVWTVKMMDGMTTECCTSELSVVNKD